MYVIKWLLAGVLMLSALGKFFVPAPGAVMPVAIQVLFGIFEVCLVAGILVHPGRAVAMGVMLLGAGGWSWVAVGQECGCFGDLVRLGRSQHLVLSGLILAAGAHLWMSAGRVARPT